MSEFDDARRRYASAHEDAESKRTELLRATQKVKRLRREAESLGRQANDGIGQSAATELRQKEQQRAKAENDVAHLREQFHSLRTNALDALTGFAVFTDPTSAVERLSDDVPIAMFPLRLETRFKTIPRGRTSQRHLCVRVFPDDALVDTFQPEISETELENVTIYWTHRWRAGRQPGAHRAAWAALVRSHGAGRAKWLTEQVVPLNLAEEPEAHAGDYLLVVSTRTPVPATEKAAISVFWARVWSTGGTERDQAFTDLESEVGTARANEIETTLAPVNLHDVTGTPDPSLNPVVTFLQLPDPSGLPLSQAAWSRPARATLLPERLVLLGFRHGKQVLQEIGRPIPSTLQIGPDPLEEDDQIEADGTDLTIPESLRWTVDFSEAVAKGMGFDVNLTELDLEPVFDRLFVLGVRVGSDAGEGANELATLISHHQASRKGFSLLPQGRPTNNTDVASSGFTWWEDPAESFKHFFETDPADDPNRWERRKDGAWLAGMLGLDRNVLRASPNYYGTDQAEARAMNIALWPATLGYYMEQMMQPVFSNETVQNTRSFFNRFVIGRGTIPLVRIGRQPYGILPATVWSQMNWWEQGSYARSAATSGLPSPKYLSGLHLLTERAVVLWRSLANSVANVGEPGTDPHQTLLDIVGLHPTSAEFYQRYAQSFTQYYNSLAFASNSLRVPMLAAMRRYVDAGLQALADFGWLVAPDGELPELLEKIFLSQANLLKGDLVQAELSETAPLTVARADGLNYIAWLQSAARTSHDALRRQTGFVNGPPSALLYLFLQHALDLGFIDTSLTFRHEALVINDEQLKAERKEPQFIQVSEQGGRSRWESLYQAAPAVTSDTSLRLGDYISRTLLTRASYLTTQVSALDVLKAATSGALERALVEHLDCLTYRLDAWRMGIQAVQLSHMRRETAEGFAKGGIYVGAYGWLEHVQAKAESLVAAELDVEQRDIFVAADEPALMHDPSNFGHIHAPSLDQAVTAAILRNGHLANATPETPDLLAVDLSSERVRLAEEMMEGIRNGQSLGALLGYRLERALHDEPNLFLDRLIYDLRRAFPLVGNRNRRTKLTTLSTITKVEARNVVDGAAFVEHLAAPEGALSYPYGLSNLPPLSDFTGPGLPSAAQIGAIIDRHVTGMRSVSDAVADLQVAESVYQIVRGNYDRASGMLDALSKGAHPPVPEIISTPRNGKALTHRLALHFKGGLLPLDPANTKVRAKGEPALAQWLAGMLPDLATVFARVSWRNTSDGPDVSSLTPSMVDLDLAPVDLFYMLDAGGALTGFDDLLIDFAEQHGSPAPRHDAFFTLEYKPAGVSGMTIFELAPLVRALRGIVLGARPLRPTDLSLQNEAGSAEDADLTVRVDKVQAVVTDLQATSAPVQNFITSLETAIGDGVAPLLARDSARDNIDRWISDYGAIVRPVLPFGLQAASLTTAIEGRRARFVAIHRAIDEVVSRWEKKRDEFDQVMVAYAALPGIAPIEERTDLLIRAGRIISTTVIAPIPPIIGDLENAITALRSAFDTELINATSLRDSAAKVGATLIALTAFVPTMEAIDQTPFDLEPFRESVLALAQDLKQKAEFLRDDINRRLATAADGLGRAATLSGDKAQQAAAEAIKALLGESFVLLHEFSLSTERLAEWDNVWINRTNLLTHLTVGPEATPFPVEDWLHGIARVRDRARQLELAALLGDALGVINSLTLEALQFPHRPDDSWVGLRFPETTPGGDPFVLEGDKLLYSAHFAPAAEIDPTRPAQKYSGLLLDEWVEVIPADQATTGLAFHFDRPNSEAPQAILLVTPPLHRGTWQWSNLVSTLHETLDLAQLRAVEPSQLDQTNLGPLVPAVISAVTMFPITAMLNYAFNNNIQTTLEGTGS